MIDFNKIDPTYLEYREIAHKILLKYYKRYTANMYYADDMIDFVVDKLIQKETDYDGSQSSRSQYRYIVTMTSAKNFYLKLKRERANLLKIVPEEYHTVNNIDKQEKKRLYDIAMQIINAHLDDIKYKCFYEHVINERELPDIAREINKTPTTVMNNANRVKKQLKHTLIEVYGADL